MRFPPFLAIAAMIAICATSGCNYSSPTASAQGNDNSQVEQAPVEIGDPLYTAAPYPKPAPQPESGAEPILAYSHVTITDKVDIPSQVDSKILFIGTEDDKGPYEYRGKRYRTLQPGDHVKKDQLVMILDDREAYAELELRREAAKSGKEIYQKAIDMNQATREGFKQKEKLYNEKQLSPLEYIMAVIEMRRSEATVTQQMADMTQKDKELEKAEVVFKKYYIRSTIDGYIQPFRSKVGESVKALETLMQIQSADALRAEGEVPVGYADRLKREMPVVIEPSKEVAPLMLRKFHTQAINAVAISGSANPLIVTVSDDKTARVWNGRSRRETAIFTHPVGVRAVACTPPGSANQYCLTGADDGKVRLWDLSNPESSDKPLRELKGFSHQSVIMSVAFSPDGKYCATADSRDIALWDVESGDFKYRFPAAHLGDITSLTFTPQAKLVSASRDNTIRLWSLGEKGAKLEFTQEGRSGDVSRPGVSHDGRYFLYDIAQTLRIMTLPDRRTEGWMEGTDDSYKFSSFAVFSNNNKMVLTGTQNEGRLSVWCAPSVGVRATELREFVPRKRMVTFTSAAISPRDDHPIAVTGTKSGEMYVWPMPTEKDMLKIKGTLKFVDLNASATKQVRIWADFDNREAKLRPGDAVTIVIEQSAK